MSKSDASPASGVPAYILAGGQSRRFGRDKARVKLMDQVLIVRLQEQLRACGHAVQVVADSRERYADLGIDSLVDAAPGCGPLAGLVAAIEHRQKLYGEGWLLLLNCDLVTWQANWSTSLRAKVGEVSPNANKPEAVHGECVVQAILDSGGMFDAVAVNDAAESAGKSRRSGEIVQPLPGLYHTSALSVAREHLQRGRLALFELLGELQTVDVPLAPTPLEFSFNTPEGLIQAEVRLRSLA